MTSGKLYLWFILVDMHPKAIAASHFSRISWIVGINQIGAIVLCTPEEVVAISGWVYGTVVEKGRIVSRIFIFYRGLCCFATISCGKYSTIITEVTYIAISRLKMNVMLITCT